MLAFINKGEIDPRLITTFGANVKEGDSPIGFFGTGLKYAIAGVLRLGGQVTIWSGIQKYKFTVANETIRGKDFGLVYMDKSGNLPMPLGFTTDLGKTWEPWMLYREFYCNALDEGGHVDVVPNTWTYAGAAGATCVLVQCPELDRVYAERDKYFLSRPVLESNSTIELRAGGSEYIYYKTVAAGRLPRKSLFSWNLVSNEALTEDRTLAHMFYLNRQITDFIVGCTNPNRIRQLLLAPKDSFEYHLDWDWCSDAPGEVFNTTLAAVYKEQLQNLSDSFKTYIRKNLPGANELRQVQMTPMQTAKLAKAKAFLEQLHYTVVAPIVVTQDLPETILGRVEAGVIYLSLRVFDQGTKQVVATLLEEHLHAAHGYLDMSRELQNFLFERLVTYAEEMLGEPL